MVNVGGLAVLDISGVFIFQSFSDVEVCNIFKGPFCCVGYGP